MCLYQRLPVKYLQYGVLNKQDKSELICDFGEQVSNMKI